MRHLEKGTNRQIDSDLQARAIRRHAYHCEVLGRNVHFPSQAVSMTRALVGDNVYNRDRRLFRFAGAPRHEVFVPRQIGPQADSAPSSVPLSSSPVVAAR